MIWTPTLHDKQNSSTDDDDQATERETMYTNYKSKSVFRKTGKLFT